MHEFRTERDSMGEVRIPRAARWGAQTQRALENFRISGHRFPRVFIRALCLIKEAAAEVNRDLSLLEDDAARAIVQAAREASGGLHDEHFPLDVFQTGSATSTNMNANEVVAHRASEILGAPDRIHPNDHVNLGQSSNDVIPSAIHISACIETTEGLLPGLRCLLDALEDRSRELREVVKTGRTHLMDAMPLTFGQEIGGWAQQVRDAIARIEGTLPRMARLAMGGTAVGTGVNAPREFGARMARRLSDLTGFPFVEAPDHFAAQGSMDAATEMSAQLKVAATALMKIADDLRWMNSGPLAGLGEIALPALQPGSSIMPGKVNPVAAEAMMMAAAQVIGNDTVVAVANTRGNFQLNVMLPVIARNLLESLSILGSASRLLAVSAVRGFTVNEARLEEALARNPILVTALNPLIGYDRATEIAKTSYREGRPILEVAAEMTEIPREELAKLLDPKRLTHP
jgi:fumarate hydratase class II